MASIPGAGNGPISILLYIYQIYKLGIYIIDLYITYIMIYHDINCAWCMNL